MAKRISLLVAACAVLQAGALFRSDDAVGLPSKDDFHALQAELPVYYQRQVREVLGPKAIANTDAQAQELSRYVRSKVNDLLPKTWRPKTSRIARALIETANKHQMDPLFLMAVIQQESHFNPYAIGRHGEIGLMQIKPDTARALLEDGVSLTEENLKVYLRNPETNIALGARYFAQLRNRYSGRSEYYISAYNMGVKRLNQVVSEGTKPQIYLSKVVRRYAALNDGYASVQLAQQAAKTAKRLPANDNQTLVAR